MDINRTLYDVPTSLLDMLVSHSDKSATLLKINCQWGRSVSASVSGVIASKATGRVTPCKCIYPGVETKSSFIGELECLFRIILSRVAIHVSYSCA